MTLIMVEPKYTGLKKVISGGQVGADQGGVAAALALGVDTGGTMPNGFITSKGPMPHLAELYGMAEDASAAYPPRTHRNVLDSDGTLIIASNPNSAGCTLTRNLAAREGRPYLIIRIRDNPSDIIYEQNTVVNWMVKNRITVLNVAGNRDRADTSHFDATKLLVTSVLIDLKRKGFVTAKMIE